MHAAFLSLGCEPAQFKFELFAKANVSVVLSKDNVSVVTRWRTGLIDLMNHVGCVMSNELWYYFDFWTCDLQGHVVTSRTFEAVSPNLMKVCMCLAQLMTSRSRRKWQLTSPFFPMIMCEVSEHYHWFVYNASCYAVEELWWHLNLMSLGSIFKG